MDIKLLLAPRIEKHCRGLLESGEYKHAAREALVQVELALRGKARLGPEFFGSRLIQRVFKGHQGVVIKVPLGDELQQKAQKYFEGVFSYYRNYVAHDGAHIDEASSVRILIIASELLDMLEASSLSLEDLGGIEGLIRVIQCKNPKRLLELLLLLDGYWMPELTYDGLFDGLHKNGFSDEQFQLAFELGLVFMNGFQTHDPMFKELAEMERLELTEIGSQVVEQIKTK